MAQRMFNLTKWQLLREGQALPFDNPRQRTVIIDVNTPVEVAFYVRQEWETVLTNPEWLRDRSAGRPLVADEGYPPGTLTDDDVTDRLLTFVGLVKGRDTLEFAVEGPFELLCEGGPAYVYSFDGQHTETRVVAPRIYTRIANRRQRNPQLEYMQYMMKLNQDAFQAQMMTEMERRVEAVKKGLESHAPQRDARTPSLRPSREAGEGAGGVPAERAEPSAPDDKGDKGGHGRGDDKRKRKVQSPPVVPDEEDVT